MSLLVYTGVFLVSFIKINCLVNSRVCLYCQRYKRILACHYFIKRNLLPACLYDERIICHIEIKILVYQMLRIYRHFYAVAVLYT